MQSWHKSKLTPNTRVPIPGKSCLSAALKSGKEGAQLGI
jgi:hypothetical protein